MKRFAAILALVILLLSTLSSCTIEGYHDGYEEGYHDGYSDAKSEMQDIMEEECLDWYDIGYDDGYDDGSDEGWMDNIQGPGRYLEDEAVHYAAWNSGMHPEDAWCIIEAYQNHQPYYDNGSMPSYQDYLDAIDSLIYFYEYFYGRHYE